MKSTRSTATVVIPTRNRLHMLRGTVASVFKQREVVVDVVVVDEGSADGTAEWLAGQASDRLCVIRHDAPRGVAAARNAGLMAAHGEWVGFLDDDDLWSPDKLRLQIDAAERVDAAWAYAASVWTDEARRAIKWNALPHPAAMPWLLLRRNVMPAGSSNVIARRRLLLELGGFDESLFQIADWDLWIRLSATSPGACCPQALIGYLSHPTSMVATHDPRQVLREFAHLTAKHRGLCEKRGIGFDHVAFSRFAAQGWIRSGRPRRGGLYLIKTGLRHRDRGNLARGAALLTGSRVAQWARQRRPPAPAPPPTPGWLLPYG